MSCVGQRCVGGIPSDFASVEKKNKSNEIRPVRFTAVSENLVKRDFSSRHLWAHPPSTRGGPLPLLCVAKLVAST